MIENIKARLRELVPEIKQVGGAADFQSAVESNPTVTPACYVFSLGEAPAPSQFAGRLIQRVRASVGIVLVVKNLTDAKGVAALEDTDALRNKVKQVVYGWRPADGNDPLERGDSNLLAFRDGHVWWQDIYLTSYIDRSEI
ncbi:hypothetical protein GTP44_01005 [Duganella sp. FT50W]|uniref:DUF3168 domain-containing protein n=1 Tax=Duganella lactea TaxID=2692173 RepID=A0A6L8MMN6_9BURK|nr:hypothetical protein [Duganella lactea]MYM80538.1 hypothetical protein [Duganella lactea]